VLFPHEMPISKIMPKYNNDPNLERIWGDLLGPAKVRFLMEKNYC